MMLDEQTLHLSPTSHGQEVLELTPALEQVGGTNSPGRKVSGIETLAGAVSAGAWLSGYLEPGERGPWFRGLAGSPSVASSAPWNSMVKWFEAPSSASIPSLVITVRAGPYCGTL